ncbi:MULTISPECIES: chemotaxis protein CheA [unclassified Fusibacter]|uniref:chemotaxis protein CheA n=1 Tax=unclassified Fusibacter TaxID=2624464 RepID=UPI0010105890|nr:MULTISPECIES: chemotaxis protein CheA [unclassified Fusibacter]MCK8058781.1 chemotaxis protein CheA [Fusibacter sp. A2]NPE21855.1 chemotaxis protein CheA [Fusibacter sp. A1]RXV61427.1 chemotaxis protein CheA [Fusibacter sp. A1]
MDMSQYMEIFIDESKEHLQHMNEILLVLENNFEDVNLLNEIFRVAHTIKGMSGTMGFTKIASLTHEMENVLHICRSREMAVDSIIIDILFECFDGLEEYINNLINTGQEGELDTSDLVNRLKFIAKHKTTDGLTGDTAAKPTEAIQEVASTQSETEFHLNTSDISPSLISEAKLSGLQAIKVKVILAETCMLRAARAFIVFNTLEQFGEVIKSHPSAEDIEDENFEYSFELLYMTKLDPETTIAELMKISEIEKVIAEVVGIGEFSYDTYEDEFESDVEEVMTASSNEPGSMAKAQLQPAGNDKSGAKENDKAKTSKTVRVDIDRLDNLMNLVSELIIIKTRLDDLDTLESKQNMSEAVEYLERITTSLHDAVMKVRMVPVERTFNRFPRMVRDLAKELDKSIKLNMSGEETEVDRTVIDEIGDPLIHLIRNSIDHGIEGMQDRVAAGKDETGTVFLRAYPDGNSVVIEVEDDGNGIDPSKISAIAISKGLVTADQVDMMNDHDIINMLFLPGFSTAEIITDLSGRGVGLDVVKTKIEALSGSVEVDSVIGKGSKFTIRLPLTLAIIQALMVNLGNEKYALPLNNIRIITTIEKKQISMVQNQEVVLYRNQTLPLVRLPEVLEVPGANRDSETLTIVIVKKGNQEAGLVVDSLIGQQEIVIKSLGKYLGGVRAIAGATILGNGGVALIVDPNQLF